MPSRLSLVPQAMATFVREVRAHRQLTEKLRQREKDTQLLLALDTNGDGMIQLSEWTELSKATGFDPVKMRERFNFYDIASRGELGFDVMEDVLHALRNEATIAGDPQIPKKIIATNAVQSNSLGQLAKQAGLV